MPQIASTFQPFSQTHATVVIAYGVAAVLLILLGRFGRRRESLETGQKLHFLWLGVVTIVQLINIVFWCVPPQLDPASSLPLHICDIMGIVTIIAMATNARWSRVLLFFWGIGLSMQGFIYPIIHENSDSMRFHIFFLSHFTIIASGLYDLFVRRFRITWVDCAMSLVYLLVYAGIIIPIDLLFDWNYGYAGKSNVVGPISKFGEWPIRLVWLFVTVASGFLILTAIATAIQALSSRKHSPRTLLASGGDR